MNFVEKQINQVRSGGLLILWKKFRAFPHWLWTGHYSQMFVSCVYKLALIIVPGSAGMYYRLAKTYFLLKRYEEAASCLGKSVALQPGFPEAYALLAETLIMLGRFTEAYAAWEHAFRLKPDWPDIHSRIQNSFFFCGQTWAARSIMQQTIDEKNNFARQHQLDGLGLRFLTEFPTAIGHIAVLDSYVKMGLLGQRSSDHPVLLVSPRLSNPCYLDYWRQYLPDMITDPEALKLLMPVARYLEDRIFVVKDSTGKQNMGDDYGGVGIQASIQAQWEVKGHSHLLNLTEADRERGWECLERLHMPPNAWFIGLHVREGKTSQRGFRDADISGYLTAIETIVKRGGWIIRMGDPSMIPLPPMEHVIDYANSKERSDWMDVFLWACCRFFIGTQSGPAWVPPTFGIPCVATNWTFFSRRWFGQDLFIPKLLWSENEKRYLTFAESLNPAIGDAESIDYLKKQGISIINNTPEELNDVVVEMLDRLEGKLHYSQEDEELQKSFNKMWNANSHKANGRIGREFLNKWKHLL
jgi:putative glycosyltransferase (TIGR04372 family)